MRIKPRHRPIRHRQCHIPRRPCGISTCKHMRHAGGPAFVNLDEHARGAVFQGAAQLLGDRAVHKDEGLSEPAVHA